MPNQNPEQTLIPKDDDEQWRKVLHGEIAAEDNNETQINAAIIRDYLLVRDEAIAVHGLAETDDLNTISEEEARVIYREASDEIRRRGKSKGFDIIKTYGSGALIGGLFVTVLFLYFERPANTVATPETVTLDDLNFSDYQPLKFNESLGSQPNMLLIPGGVATIGCSKGWDDAAGGCRPSEFPPHTVSVKTFEISQHEVTMGQFRKFIESTKYITDAEKENRGCVHEDMEAPGHPFVMNRDLTWINPGYEQNDSYPVTCVSWHDAQNYIDWLSSETNTNFRLPSEAEWEYAARGGQSTAYFWGSQASNNQANYKGIGGKDKWKFAAPVGQFPANKYFVQDTAGNLWEWVEDCWHDTYQGAPTDGRVWDSKCKDPNIRVRRGGAWDGNKVGIRSANRSTGFKNDRSNLYGFRVARDWQKKQD